MVAEWSAHRLRSMLQQQFAGQQIIVVSNREPCVHDLCDDGSIRMRRPVSGLVTALDPVVRASGGTWIAHGSGTADRAVVDDRDRVHVGGDAGGYTLRRIWLTKGEERGHYQGFSNGALWPLCHLAFESPRFSDRDWRHYQTVNRRFADAVVAEARSARPVVFVQDYHFAVLPALLRARLPDATIVTFWHIPWPNAARLSRLPCGDALIEGLLGSDVLGFQIAAHAKAFLDAAATLDDAAIDRASGLIARRHGAVRVRAYPISVPWPGQAVRAAPSVAECRRSVREALRIDAAAPMMLAVDRLDYTKGIEERFRAIRRLLARGNATVGRPVFVQVAAPSRTRDERYRQFGERVRAAAASINQRFGAEGYQPLILIDQSLGAEELQRFYRAADACHVNSLDDGMNLVAKEFVAARDDDAGVLLLSVFAGAARELTTALPVNPFDIDGVANAIAAALTLPPEEQAWRMRAMRRQVADHNVYRWAAELLLDARIQSRQDGRRPGLAIPLSDGRPGTARVLTSRV